MKTQVAIIGGGPAGMLLSHMLHQHGITSIVLEKHSRAHVLARIRAGVLEPSTVEVLQRYGLGERLAREGKPHNGMRMVWEAAGGGGELFIDTQALVGKQLTTYGQTSIQEDLYKAADARGAALMTEAADVRLVNLESATPQVQCMADGKPLTIT
mgnify:CR=1 FL=1